MRRFFRASVASGLMSMAVLLTWLVTSLAPAHAAEKLRVAKVVPFAWSFTPLDIGIQTGIFAKHGLDIEESASAGDAKLQQLLTSGSIDIGIGSRPRHGLHRQGRAGQGRRRDVRRAAKHGGDGRLRFRHQDGGGSQGQEARLHHGRFADRLDRRPHQPEGRLGHKRHHRGADRRHAAGARRDQDPSDRRLYRGARNRLRARGSQGMARHHRARRRSSINSSRT